MLNQPITPSLKLLRQPLTEFMFRVSSPANLSKTFNRLMFDALRQQTTFSPDELENLHALSDLLLSFQVFSQATTIEVAEA